MNFAMALHSGDKDQVARWLAWVSELGGMGRHKLWLMPCKGTEADFKTDIPFTALVDSYGIRTDWSAHNGPVRCASGPNSMIRQFAWHFYMGKLGAFMFIEPDCIPLREGWHDAIEDEYNRERKPFMGAFVPGVAGQYPDHATGNMVLPQNALEVSKLLMLPTTAVVEATGTRVELAFDVAAAPDIIPRMHRTNLIQHVFRGPKFRTREDLKRVNPSAVLFHTDKDGGLIDLLSAQRGKGVLRDSGMVKSEASPNGNVVMTYYEDLHGSDKVEQEWLLARWSESWTKQGWIPKVIGKREAMAHPFFDDYKKVIEALPTVNRRDYEEACWYRWLAMVTVGGGVMTDYDVMNYGFTPGDAKVSMGDLPTILADKNPCPCAVNGTAAQYASAVNVIMNRAAQAQIMERGQPHVSDQSFVQANAERFAVSDICYQHGRDGSYEAKLVHYSNSACQGRSRRGVIETAEKTRNGVIVETASKAEPRTVMDEIRERLEWVRDNSKGITRHHVHKELKKLGLLPKK